ncbi:MAG: glycoside hydrolase family 2 protein [Myxococcales bacterium]|nr:glycoside hydrolase family 2 protein [Myxococcales bacterium]
MSGRVRAIEGHDIEALETGWQMGSLPSGAALSPDGLERSGADWLPARAPATAASTLRAAGKWSLDGPARRFDADDWWWRCRFPAGAAADEVALCFDGLATLAEVWLNGAPLLSSANMFTAHERRVDGLLGAENDLAIRFRSLDPFLAARRPRPRWRAPMVEHQQLRWLRTTLLGRTPGWSPPAAAVGPWRPVRIERRRAIAVEALVLRTRIEGTSGVLEAAVDVRALGAARVEGVELCLDRDGIEHRAPLVSDGGRWQGRVAIADVARWWPHTHGEPCLYRARLLAWAGGAPIEVDLGSVGFREVEIAGDFGLRVNGVDLFCRGACWTPLDPVSLDADQGALDAALDQACAAGMNMLRVAGPMVYESDLFLDGLDRRGLLLWQDFLFANLDYPEDDPAFVATVSEEARQQLARLAGRPCLAVLCGNSEVEQQAAMWGAPRERWSPRLFHEVLAEIARVERPDVPYWPSSAHGGAFPHAADSGTTSYYGVGAYLRPLEDARRAGVRFATECLAFANVPPSGGLSPSLRAHQPEWKARSPRDLGAGWDFDDVRDHYLARLFRVDPVALRSFDHERYLALSRVVTGEVMAATLGEWRRAGSTCRGALVWFLRDLWPGAGFGVVDAAGAPKAALSCLARVQQPVLVHLSDEGGNGLVVHVVNERAAPLRGEIEVALFRDGEVEVGLGRRAVEVAGRGAIALPAAGLFAEMHDLTYAYRFGPPQHDLVVATLSAEGKTIDAFAFPLGLPALRERDLGLTAEPQVLEGGDAALTLRTRRFAQSVAIEVEGFVPDDDHFHMAPGSERTIHLRRSRGSASGGAVRGVVQPLNAESATRVRIGP